MLCKPGIHTGFELLFGLICLCCGVFRGKQLIFHKLIKGYQLTFLKTRFKTFITSCFAPLTVCISISYSV